MPLNFITISSAGRAERDRAKSTFVLVKDTWDDYGHELKFHLHYLDGDSRPTRIGSLKLLQRRLTADSRMAVATNTELPNAFSDLDDDFVSLGQTDEYYQKLHQRFPDSAGEILVALRDIAWSPALASPFEPLSAFRNGLVRENSALRARRLGRSYALGNEPHEQPAFAYSCPLDDEKPPIEFRAPFDPNDLVPGRVVGIVGRNAAGKTRFLAQLASDLAQTSRISQARVDERDQRFPEGFPLFTRVLAVSYSAFDQFKRPKVHDSSSYVYCGIRDDKGQLSQKALQLSYERNKERVRQANRDSEWIEHITEILDDRDSALFETLKSEISGTQGVRAFFESLSSGQAMLCHFVTGLLAWLQPNSLLLFDEPETHLHPNAVANLFQVLTAILKSTDSVAILTTHSPVVLQEIPGDRVVIFRRHEGGTEAKVLGMESFGESISELTRHVFETVEIDNLYKSTLKRLAARESAEEVQARFPKGLSMNAKAYLLARYADPERSAR